MHHTFFPNTRSGVTIQYYFLAFARSSRFHFFRMANSCRFFAAAAASEDMMLAAVAAAAATSPPRGPVNSSRHAPDAAPSGMYARRGRKHTRAAL